MGPHYTSPFFNPGSVAIVGASERPGSVGQRLIMNMLDAGFRGQLFPVNPSRKQINGIESYPDIAAINAVPDLVVIATPAPTVPGIVQQCGEKGVRSIVIISAGFGETGTTGKRLQQDILAIAQRYNIRIIGPNCLGIIRPSAHLNATFSFGNVQDGQLALVSQSGAVCTAIMDWAEAQSIGFSTVVSMGGAADLDFGEILDFLAMDPKTTGILLYIEGINDARGFLSGLKAAARLKPVIIIKSGRHEAGSKAASSHTGALVGGDDVFSAAIERAGVVRAYSIAQLFAAARVLANNYALDQNRLAIITNAGGPGVMSTDRAEDVGVQLAQLSPESLQELDNVLPAHWSHGNPVDILGDATPERYRQALETCLKDRQIDGVLAILTPQAMTDPSTVAEHIIAAADASDKPVLASWTGGQRVQHGRDLFAKSRVAHFNTPETAVDAFSFLTQFTRNQKLLKQIPASTHPYNPPDVAGTRLIIERVLAEGREQLSTQESKAILAAFNIPVTQAIKVSSATEAMIAAETLGFPVVLKVNMAEFSHKSDIGGVRLNLSSAQGVAHDYQEMENQIRQKHPEIEQVLMTVETMYRPANGRELMVGVVRDPVFGPAISFGLGGTMVEIMHDRAVALPPLNEYIVEKMIARTKAAKYLQSFRQLPPVNQSALTGLLLNVSTMVSELPEIRELDINPLIVDPQGVMAVDARISVKLSLQLSPYTHMAIHPYPQEMISHYQLPDGTEITIRPIRPDDADIEQQFVKRLSERSKYFRFMQSLHELTPEMLVRFTQIDYDREMAFIAVTEREKSQFEMGVGRYMLNPDGNSVEFALVVSDDCQGRGIGTRIMKKLLQAAKNKGVTWFTGEVLAVNKPMLSLVSKLGFSIEPIDGDTEVVRVIKDLRK